MWILKIFYSWGDTEPDQFFDSREKAWDTACHEAIDEANAALDDRDDHAILDICPASGRIILSYPWMLSHENEEMTCIYQIVKEKENL